MVTAISTRNPLPMSSWALPLNSSIRIGFEHVFRVSLGNYVYYDFLSNRAVVSQSGLYSNSALHNSTPEAVALGFTGVGAGKHNYLSDYFVRNALLEVLQHYFGYSFPHCSRSQVMKHVPAVHSLLLKIHSLYPSTKVSTKWQAVST